jgi:ligand-binding SRPBCC domain-containing protein
MSLHVLERRQVVPGDLETVFGFFQDPMNLEAITPPWMHFEVLSSTDARVRKGTEIVYRLRWQIFPLTWKSRISEYTGDTMFADEMLKGPYRRWHHAHLFSSVPDGVEVTDMVQYELPLGLLGRLIHTLVVRSQLEAIFDYRREAIARIFGSPQSAGARS